MPFSVQRVGQILSTRADRLAIAPYDSTSREVITLTWNGNQVTHTLWTLMPDGSLYGTELNSQPGGPELAVASFSQTRVVSMHRFGQPAALKFEAWKTGGFFELSDDAMGPSDREPQLAPFGGDPGNLPIQTPATEPGPPPGPPKFEVNKKIVIKMGPKAGHAAVATITQDHHLRLSLWGFDNGGNYKVMVGKHAEVDGGAASAVSLVKVKEHWVEGPRVTAAEVVTAVSGEGHILKLQRWRINLYSQGTPASIQLMSEHTAAEAITEVSAVAVTAMRGTQVATAVRLEDGTLKVIGWKVEAAGGMSRWLEASGGAITSVSAAHVRGGNIVTALREADGRFKASYWRFPTSAAGTLEHRQDVVEGNIGFHLRCVHVPGEGSQLGDTVAATQTQDGKLQLFRYRVTDG